MIEKIRRICIANANYDEGSLTPIVPLPRLFIHESVRFKAYWIKIRKGQQLKQQNNLRGIVVPVYLYFLVTSLVLLFRPMFQLRKAYSIYCDSYVQTV
jgi:hypothetical protein